jgi:uncharacterized protein (DUF58 family)
MLVLQMPAAVHQHRSCFLDVKALAGLAHMRFVTRRTIEGTYSGRHRSRRHGGGAEFVDYREYVEGEDLRRVDWKVLARTGRAYVRLLQDETNLRCTLALDASGSMLFGGHRGQSKLEYAQYLATALSQVIGQQQDQVGLAILNDELREHLLPGGTPAHVARLQELIESIQTKPTTDLAAGLRDLFSRAQRRGVLVLMSDFLVDEPDAVFGALQMFRHRHWEIIALHLVHPDEERLPNGRAFRFEGLENDGAIDCSPADVRRLYEQRFAAHAAMVRGLALGAGCDYRRISTAEPYLQTLRSFLVDRSD